MNALNSAAQEALEVTERTKRPDNGLYCLMSAILANPRIAADLRKRASAQLDRIEGQRYHRAPKYA